MVIIYRLSKIGLCIIGVCITVIYRHTNKSCTIAEHSMSHKLKLHAFLYLVKYSHLPAKPTDPPIST